MPWWCCLPCCAWARSALWVGAASGVVGQGHHGARRCGAPERGDLSRPAGHADEDHACRQLPHASTCSRCAGCSRPCPGCARRWCSASFRTACACTLQEHQAVAWWGQAGSGQLVNDAGRGVRRQPGRQSMACPSWPARPSSRRRSGRCTSRWPTELARLELGLERLELNERGSWRAALDNGAAHRAGPWHPRRAAGAHRAASPPRSSQLTQRYPGALAIGRPALSQWLRDARARRDHGHRRRPATNPNPTRGNHEDHHGQGIQGSRRRTGHRHRQDHGGGGRGAGRRRAQARRPGRGGQPRPQARRGGQHRRHRAEHPAGAERGRADGRLPHRPRLHRHHRQPHPRHQLQRHGGDQGPRGHARPTWPA